MPEPIILLQETSPSAPVIATVEADGTTVYLYLNGAPRTSFGMRSLWVANLAPAPEALDYERMRRGEAPMMPLNGTRRPQGVKLAELEPLTLLWYPEGTGAALYGKDELLAILPPGIPESDAFSGFSRDCAQQTRLAWPLSGAQGTQALAELDRADAFWESWEQEQTWPALRTRLLSAVDTALGTDGQYFKLGDAEWPPAFLAVRRTREATVLVTGGTAIRPQPGAARPLAKAQGPRRIELALALRGDVNEPNLSSLCHYLSAQSQLPWLRFSWLGPGHTLDCDVLPVTASARFPAVICVEAPRGAPALEFPAYDGDPVHLLWLVPITAAERELAVKHGSHVLMDRLERLGEIWAHGDRADLGVAN